MPTIDKYMELAPNDCPRCGHSKSHHKLIIDGEAHIPCIRKKPYKLKDGADLKLGMQVWHCHPWDNSPIITGMVRFITKWGNVCLWKYPEDRIPEKYTLPNGETIDMIGRMAYDFPLSASFSCFSSLENAEKFREKCLKEKEESKVRIKKWEEKQNEKR